jgi:hypothetical protein
VSHSYWQRGVGCRRLVHEVLARWTFVKNFSAGGGGRGAEQKWRAKASALKLLRPSPRSLMLPVAYSRDALLAQLVFRTHLHQRLGLCFRPWSSSSNLLHFVLGNLSHDSEGRVVRE